MFPKAQRPKTSEDAGPAVTPHKRTDAGWQNERQRWANKASEKSRIGRNIAPNYPAVVDPVRKERCRKNFKRFCTVYLPRKFNKPWSKAHKRAIVKIWRAIARGGLFALAMPRGSGKTTLVEAAILWALLYGYRRFVMVFGASKSSAIKILRAVKVHLESNELLAADFPEVCHPIRELEGIVNRCNGQHFDGQRTQMKWTEELLILPTMPDSVASGAILRVSGADGAFRGEKFERVDGNGQVTPARPDLAIIDDIQKKKTASSPLQVEKLKDIVNSDILGLAGPDQRITAFFLCTVICENDLADQMLDRERNPEWQGERTKALTSLPTNDVLWEQYWKIRCEDLRADGDGSPATEFYRKNRAAMDAGARPSWPERFESDCLSAIQSAMNFKLARPEAFASEMQNEPLKKRSLETGLLSARQICEKFNRLDQQVIPVNATRLTGFIDVQKNALFWGVAGFETDFSGAVVDYGVYPEQVTTKFRYDNIKLSLQSFLEAGSFEEALHRGLEKLMELLICRSWRKEDGSPATLDRLLVDCNWEESRAIVRRLCNDARFRAVAMPSRGMAIKATGGEFNDRARREGEERGLNWRTEVTKDHPIQRLMTYETNFWKTFVHQRLKVGIGGKGCLSLFGIKADVHELLAEHLLSEIPELIHNETSGRSVTYWTLPPAKPDNHWFDVLVGCHAAAAERGISLDQNRLEARQRKKIKLSDIQKQKRNGRM